MALNGQGDGNGSFWQDVAAGLSSGVASVALIFIQTNVMPYFERDPYYHFLIRIILYIVTTLLAILMVVYLFTAVLEKIDETRYKHALTNAYIRTLGKQGQIAGPSTPQIGGRIYDADKQHVSYPQRQRIAQVRKVASATFLSSLAFGIIGIGSTFMKSHFAPMPLPKVTPTPTIISRPYTVYANRDWQNTGIVAHAGDTVSIVYLQGQWNAWPGNYPDSDGNGPQGIDTTCTCDQPLAGYSTQGLIGRIGSGAPFFVGDNKTLQAPSSGNVELRIDDDVLSDNTGSLQMRITIQP